MTYMAKQEGYYWYEFTKYPNIYKSSYWGNFNRDQELPDEVIIKNRNQFAKKYKILEGLKGLKSRYENFYFEWEQVNRVDHWEDYVTETGEVLIIQSFTHEIDKGYGYNEERFNLMDKTLWKEIPPMYALEQKTYLANISHILPKEAFKKCVQERFS